MESLWHKTINNLQQETRMQIAQQMEDKQMAEDDTPCSKGAAATSRGRGAAVAQGCSSKRAAVPGCSSGRGKRRKMRKWQRLHREQIAENDACLGADHK
eukprot:1161736-Pelagomonas_calceolata.AAC.12